MTRPARSAKAWRCASSVMAAASGAAATSSAPKLYWRMHQVKRKKA